MAAEKSPYNKTLDMSVEEGSEYLGRCLDFFKTVNGVDAATANETLTSLNRHGAATGSPATQALTLNQITDKTILGDTFKVLASLPESFAHLAIVDPPYNLTKNYAGKSFNEQSMEDYRTYTRDWLDLVLPRLVPGASLYVCCDWKSSVAIADVLYELEGQKRLAVQNRITWQREKGRGAKHNWKNGMEDIWFCTVPDTDGKCDNFTFNLEAVKMRRRVIAPYREGGKTGAPKDWSETEGQKFRDTCPSNFWDDISIPFWSMAENTAHPTQKPEKLIAKLILASSNEGDIVLDPFLGSGTTSVTAKKLARHYVGIEQSEQYCIWAEKRLEDAEHDKSIQGYTDGVFWERNTQNEQSGRR